MLLSVRFVPSLIASSGSPDLTSTSCADSEPSFAERLYWAEKRREFERTDPRMGHSLSLLTMLQPSKRKARQMENTELGADAQEDLVGLPDRERDLANARRVLRQAGWATVFYLIT